MSRSYYATYHRYGIEFCNDYDILYRFATKMERDAFVEDANYNETGRYGGYRTESVTRDEARSHFPDAFRRFDCHDTADERDWLKEDAGTVSYWSQSNF